MNEASSYFFLTRNGVGDPDPDGMFAAFSERLRKPGAKLLLHFHGGLVDEAAGTATATRLAGAVPAGWGLDSAWTQAFVVWRTGFWETLKTDVPPVFSSKLSESFPAL